MVIDWLTKNADCFCNDLVVFEQPPRGVVNLFFDLTGCTQNRFVSA